ncbi:MAG TPA: hypothetical protein VFP56_01440 [Candidatus Limnocylindrales bacterium]|nr:hypothetical protein [Candidatus Limnocylindrales bacterium]
MALLAAALLAACGSNPPSGALGSGESLPGATSGGTSQDPLGSLGPPPSPSPPDDATGVLLDPTVLIVLPPTIDGVALNEDATEAATLLNTLDLGQVAEAADAAVAVDGSNLVVAWVVRLRPGAFGEAAFQQWRDSYDQGACTASGGVVGRAQAELGGRNTYVTSCVAALRTYHVWLEDQRLLVSASSVGEGRFGEKLMSTLQVPD